MREKIFQYFESKISPFDFKRKLFSDQSIIKTLLRVVLAMKGLSFSLFIFGILCSAIEVYLIHAIGVIVDIFNSALKQGLQPLTALKDNSVFFGFFIFTLLLIRPLAKSLNLLIINQSVTLRLSPLIRWQLYKQTLLNKMSFFSQNNPGKIASSIWQSGQAINEMATLFFQHIWSTLTFFVFSFSALIFINPLLLPPIIAWFIVYLFLAKKYIPQTKKNARASADESIFLNGKFVDVFSNIFTVKAFSQADRNHDQDPVRGSFERFVDKSSKFLRSITAVESAMTLTSSVVMIAVTLLIIKLWLEDKITGGDIAVTYTFLFKLEGLFSVLMNQFTSLFRAFSLFKSSMALLITRSQESFEGQALPLQAPKEIEFRNVTFGYNPEEPNLKNFNLKISKGERIGVIGLTGSGKSTLFKLLMRMHDVNSGQLLINGTDIKRHSLKDIRESIAIISQDSNLFEGTIEYNIKYGNFDITSEEMSKVIDACYLYDISNGMNSVDDILMRQVGSKNNNISGGQAQRVNIARGLVKNSSILLLDEITSSLDSQTEHKIMTNLERYFHGKTVICISHRLNTLIKMDRLIIIDKGRVLAEGTHAEILKFTQQNGGLWSNAMLNSADYAVD